MDTATDDERLAEPENQEFRNFLRVFTALAMLAGLVIAVFLVSFGVARLHDVMFPSLVCVDAHDEFHQTANGTQVTICDKYERR